MVGRLLAAVLAVLLLASPVSAADGDTIGGRLSMTQTYATVTDLGTLTADVTLTSTQRNLQIDPPTVTLATGESYTWTFAHPLRCGQSVTASFRTASGNVGMALGMTWSWGCKVK